MSFLSSFFPGRPPRTVALLDIGSGSIGAALFSYTHQQEGKEASLLLATTRVTVEEGDGKTLLPAIEKALGQALKNLYSPKTPRPEKFVVFLSAPFYVSQSRLISYQQAGGFTFTEKILHQLTKAEIDKFRLNHKDIFGEETQASMFILENKIMQVKLNGYVTDQPFKQKAEEAEIAQFISAGQSPILERLRAVINRETHSNAIDFHSSGFAFYTAWRDILPGHQRFMLIDIYGETTDLIIVQNGVIVENISFQGGSKNLVAAVSQVRGGNREETLSQLKMLAEGELLPAAGKALQQNLEEAKKEWLEKLHRAFTTVVETIFLPETMIVLGDSPLHHLFSQWLSVTDLSEYMLAHDPAAVKFLDYALALSVASPDRQKLQADPLLLEAFCYDRLRAVHN